MNPNTRRMTKGQRIAVRLLAWTYLTLGAIAFVVFCFTQSIFALIVAALGLFFGYAMHKRVKAEAAEHKARRAADHIMNNHPAGTL